MTPKEMKDIVCHAVTAYGVSNQLVVAIEECAELQKELTKALRQTPDKRHITEEMADVQIMLWQLSYILGTNTDMQTWIEQKLRRLNERIAQVETKSL